MHYDTEIAKISAWCRKHGYTCHVSLRGELELRKKRCSPRVMSSNTCSPTMGTVIVTDPIETTATGKTGR